MTKNLRYTPGTFFLENLVKLPLIISVCILLSLILYRILLIYSYNGEVGGIDNNFVYDVLRSLKGLDIYTNPAKPPYAITLYPPIYYNICTAVGKIMHINPDEPISVYRLCRAISFICDAVTCILLYQILKNRFSIKKEIALFSVTGFACIICHLGYTFSRCDSIFLTFYAAFLYILTGKEHPKKFIFIVLLALLSNACIFSKQNGIITPILAIMWMITGKQRMLAGKFFLYFIIFFAAALVMYVFIFDYEYLFLNTVKALRNRIDLAWFYSDIFKRSLNSLWVLPLYAAAIIAFHDYFKSVPGIGKQLAAIFIIQFVFSFCASFKWGSSAGYFNESFILGFILITRKLGNSENKFFTPYRQKIIYALTPLLILFAIHTNAQGYLFFIQNKKEKMLSYDQQKKVRDFLEPKLQDHYLLNMSSPSSDFFKTLFCKEILVPNDDMVGCCTYPDNTFDYSSLTENIRSGSVKYLILSDTSLPDKVWNASLQHFSYDTAIYTYVIYKYRE